MFVASLRRRRRARPSCRRRRGSPFLPPSHPPACRRLARRPCRPPSVPAPPSLPYSPRPPSVPAPSGHRCAAAAEHAVPAPLRRCRAAVEHAVRAPLPPSLRRRPILACGTPSSLSELQVHFNNDRSRDFKNASLPTEQRPRPSQSQQGFPDPGGLYAFQQPGAPYAQGAMLFGNKLEVNNSKYPNITPAPDAQDYTSSSLNRFNSDVVKNYRHCCSPTKMIHISALPQDISEDVVIGHVSEHGSIVGTKLFEANGKRQALILFETEEEATEALVLKHASSLEGNTIRISFSQMQSI